MYISVNVPCTRAEMDLRRRRAHSLFMASPSEPRHYLRAWRKHRDLTLEQVAERVEMLGAERRGAGEDPLANPKTMTHASLSRIERGLQPYSQALLEILADIYQTDPASLLIRDPSDPDGIWSIWDRLQRRQRKDAVAMLSALVARTGTDG